MYFTLKNQNIRCIIEVWKGRIFMEWKQLQEAAERLRTQLASIHKFKQQQDAIQRQLRHVNTDTRARVSNTILGLEGKLRRQRLQVRKFRRKREKFSLLIKKHCFSKTIGVKW